MKWLIFLAASLFAVSSPAQSQVPAPVKMWRLDCGLFDIDNLEGRGRVLMPVSCYLIRHGDQLVLFDAGMTSELHGKSQRDGGQTLSLTKTLAEQLALIDVDPATIQTLVVSHYHGDHHGQAEAVKNARLVIGAADATALQGEVDKGGLGPWLEGNRRIEEISADRDLFGDGSVVVLHTPGHTPGHLSMLVKPGAKAFILTGDLVHGRSQLAERKPSGNHVDKDRGKAEIERVIALAGREKAVIIVGHDADDVRLLPAFPKAAE